MNFISLILLLLFPAISNSHDLWSMLDGTNWVLGNSNECVTIRYYDNIGIADNIPKPLSESQIKYPWRAANITEQAACDKLRVAAGALSAKVLKAVPSSNGTRKTRDITATTYTSTRIPDSSLCEGAIIKKYQTNKNWYKVKDLNLTTLCGEY